MVEIGDSVTFVDQYAVEHEGLVTQVWGSTQVVQKDGQDIVWEPCINLLYVSKDGNRGDQYGRQIERASSVQHQSTATAHGYYYKTK